MELLRAGFGGLMPRWQVLLLLLLSFNAVSVLRFSGAAENPVIFEFGRLPFVPEQYSVEVPGGANVSQIDSSMISCFEPFVAYNDNLVLDRGATYTANKGTCLCDYPVQLTPSTSRNDSPITSFSTMFQLGVGAATNTTQMSFIIANDTSPTQSSAYFAVNFQVFQGAQYPYVDHLLVSLSVNEISSTFMASTGPSGNFSYEGVGVSFDVWIQYNYPLLQVFSSGSTPNFDKPTAAIINANVYLTAPPQQSMYVGFSGSNTNVSISEFSGNLTYSAVYISGWTFNSDGPAPDFPRLSNGKVGDPAAEKARKEKRERQQIILITSVTIPSVLIFLLLVVMIFELYKRNARLTALAKKYEIEEGLLDQGPRTFKYKVLSAATKGFSSNALLGSGGFGSVYRGKLWLKGDEKPTEIAVKRISATSHQGAREFLAEVKIIRQVQHRNLVRLLGWYRAPWCEVAEIRFTAISVGFSSPLTHNLPR